jgi:hypothetical protein
MEKYIVLKDKISYKKEFKYASAGDVVTCVCWHGDVCIAKTSKGVLFSIHKDNIKKIPSSIEGH